MPYVEIEKVLETARNGYHSDFGRSMADLTSLQEVLEDIPTADVAEVKRGHWILSKVENAWNEAQYPAEYTCSVCGRTEPQEEPYCHCGADMRSSEEK